MVHFPKRQAIFRILKTWYCLQKSLRTTTPSPIWSTAPLTNPMCHALPHLSKPWHVLMPYLKYSPFLGPLWPTLPLANFYCPSSLNSNMIFPRIHLPECPHGVASVKASISSSPGNYSTVYLVLCSSERKVLSGQGVCVSGLSTYCQLQAQAWHTQSSQSSLISEMNKEMNGHHPLTPRSLRSPIPASSFSTHVPQSNKKWC